MTYQPKVYKKQGGTELVIANGGTLTIEVGATVTGLAAVAEQAAITDLGASNLAATTITLSTTDTYTDGAVKSAVDTGLAGVTSKVETRLDAIDAKIDDILAKLRLANVIADA